MGDKEGDRIDWPDWCYTNTNNTNTQSKAETTEDSARGRGFGFLRGRRRRGGRVAGQGLGRGEIIMTEKTEGGGQGQERQEGASGRREGGPPPRSYSEFMRSLAAKYNNENPAESNRADTADPRLAQTGKPMTFPPGVPLGFPQFMFPPASLPEGMKESGPPVSSPFHFLSGFRAPPGAHGFPPGLLPHGLLDPNHAQALLSMMRGQITNHPPQVRSAANPPLDLTAAEHPAKKMKRDSSSIEDPPVSPPPSHPEPSRNSCQSLCAMSQSCSEEGRLVINWSTEEVVGFVSSISQCQEYAEVFLREKIDGGVLVLLTDTHLQSLGIKLGPALKLRSALADKLGTCPHCRHCRHCHAMQTEASAE